MTIQKKKVDIYTLPHQRQVLDAVLNKGVRQVNIRGGAGSGKTATLALLLYLAQRQWPNTPFLIASSTWINLIACLTEMGKFWDRLGLGVRYAIHKGGMNPTLELSIVKNGKWITVFHPLRSLFDDSKLVAFQAGGLIVDEAAGCKESGFMEASTRIRLPNAPLFKIYAGTPRGPNWFAEFIERQEEKGYILNIKGIRTVDNPYLPKDFITDIKRKFDGTPFAAQELDGEIVSLGDMCFPNVELRNFIPDPKQEYCMAVDFGFNRPALLALQRKNKMGDWGIFHSYTPIEMTITDALYGFMNGLKKYGITKNPMRVAYDPAGRNKSDQTNRSSAMDLEDFFRQRDSNNIPRYDYSFRKMDRSIEYGIQNMRTVLDKGKIFVASHEEKKKPGEHASVYTSLKMCEYKKVGNTVDHTEYRKDNGYDHICDAIRYFIQFSPAFDVLDIRGRTKNVDPEIIQGY